MLLNINKFCFVDRASLYCLLNKTNLVHNLFLVYLSIYLVCIPDSHPQRITSTKYRINTVVSPDDGHIVAQNM